MELEQKETPALDSWRAYARHHPLRARIRDALARGGSRDTAELASALGESPALVEYHRQVLAMAGRRQPLTER